MKRSRLSTLTAAALVAGTATIAAAAPATPPDAYGYRGYSYEYDGNMIPQAGPYDRSTAYDGGYGWSTRPTITDPSGEGGGVQNPHLGPGINGSQF